MYIDSCTEGSNASGPITLSKQLGSGMTIRPGAGLRRYPHLVSSTAIPSLQLSIYLMHWPFCRRKQHGTRPYVSAGTTFSVSLFRYVLTRWSHVKYHVLFRPSLVTFLLMMYRLRKSIIAYSHQCLSNSRVHCSVNANLLLVSLLRNRKLKSEVSSFSYLHKNVRPVFINSYVPVC